MDYPAIPGTHSQEEPKLPRQKLKVMPFLDESRQIETSKFSCSPSKLGRPNSELDPASLKVEHGH